MKTKPAGGPARELDREIVERIAKIASNTPRAAQAGFDNSNTQFAVLGLWAARRHGLPADDALRHVDAYFRLSIMADGSWGYMGGQYTRGRLAMTCAGLLGLATYAGSVRERSVKTQSDGKGGKPPTYRDPLRDPLVMAATAVVAVELSLMTGLPMNEDIERDYYALWSVERVAMVYSLNTIGSVAWYRLGATMILQAQQPVGLWKARHEAEVDTSFALLFLKRSNLLPDLTQVLRSKPDPGRAEAKADGKSTLRAGEVPLPKAAVDPLDALARELQAASPDERTAAISKLRDAKGAENTEKLAGVIPKLPPELQKAVRDALAERLARMTADTLRAKLKDANAELRRAAAVACALKEDASLTVDLIATLDDKDAWVVRAAGVALRQLTGQDFGPRADATADERSRAVVAWKEWWRNKRPK